MKKLRGIWLMIGLALMVHANAQESKVWGNYLINLPAGWSSSLRNGIQTLSNYNLKSEEPIELKLFPPESFSGKQDTLFTHVWSKLVTNILHGVPAPRARRFFTNYSEPFYQGFTELTSVEPTGYYQLNIFVHENTWQACLLIMSSAKSYRLVQAEWLERMLAVIPVSAKK